MLPTLRDKDEFGRECVGRGVVHLRVMPLGEDAKKRADTVLESYDVRQMGGLELLQATKAGRQLGLVPNNAVLMHIYDAVPGRTIRKGWPCRWLPARPIFANRPQQLLWLVYGKPTDQLTTGRIGRDYEKEGENCTRITTIGRLLTCKTVGTGNDPET